MSQQETGLTFDVLILSWTQQSSSESKPTDVVVIHCDAGPGDKIWIRSQLVWVFFFFFSFLQMLKFEDINESLAQVQFQSQQTGEEDMQFR